MTKMNYFAIIFIWVFIYLFYFINKNKNKNNWVKNLQLGKTNFVTLLV